MLLFSTDIDGTIFDGPETAEIFAAFWKNLQELPEKPILVYNTGRLLGDVQALVESTSLPAPNYIISGVGTEIFDCSASSEVEAWNESLSGSWNFDSVYELISSKVSDIEPQPDECQNPFKCSWFYYDKAREDLDRIATMLESAGIDAQVIYSSNRDLDLLPAGANKGNALKWLAAWKGIPLQHVAVAGDSGNDASMFLVDEVYGVVVSNAEEALAHAVSGGNIFMAKQPCARGVIEGLKNFLEPADQPSNLDPSSAG